MTENYYRHVRVDIEPLLPATARCILDLGAGTGATSAWLKSRYPGCKTVALEGNAAVMEELSQNVDKAILVDLNENLPDVASPDLILCLDVLEHLVDPLKVLTQITRRMQQSGTVIVSLPNVAHASVSIPLLLKGRFEYQDAGILDRTHLRFFDRRSAIALLNKAGLTVSNGVRVGPRNPRSWAIDAITCGMVRDHLTRQYVLAGRPGSAIQPNPITWRLA
jgi:SAM-dependent methyltransferase